MIDSKECRIEQFMVHYVGNKSLGEPLHLGDSVLETSEELEKSLTKMITSSLSDMNVYRFKKGSINPVMEAAEAVFNAEEFVAQGQKIAEQLYKVGVEENIKPGLLYIMYVTGLKDDFGVMDAVAILKSEIKHPFVRTDVADVSFEMNFENGYPLEKPDKGAVVLNTNADEGYRVSFMDRSGKSGELGYWTADFLEIEPCATDFQYTKSMMNLASEFVSKKMPQDFSFSKEEQGDVLGKAAEYFEKNETFSRESFEANIFEEPAVAESFREFSEERMQEKGLPVTDNFPISETAVKQEGKVFKSIIKLDKNFHLYVHGNRQLIEKGYDEEKGKKFYKVYYDIES